MLQNKQMSPERRNGKTPKKILSLFKFCLTAYTVFKIYDVWQDNSSKVSLLVILNLNDKESRDHIIETKSTGSEDKSNWHGN